MERGRTGHVSWLRSGPHVDAVFLHGYSDSARTWLPSLTALADRRGLLFVDARGHGYSDLPDEPFGPTAMADDAAMVLDALGVNHKVTVIGGSMGGLTAAILAARRPDLVAALVLEEPSPGTRTPTPSEPKMVRPDWLIHLKALDLTGKIAWAIQNHPTWPADELAPWAEAIGQIDLAIHDRPWEVSIWLPDIMCSVSCHTSFILGDRAHGSLLDAATEAACVRSTGSSATVERIKGVGHGVHRESRDDCLRLIERTI